MSKVDPTNILFYFKFILCTLLIILALICVAIAYIRWLDKKSAKEYLGYAGAILALCLGVFALGALVPSPNANDLKLLHIALKTILCVFFFLLFLISLFVRKHLHQLGKDDGSTIAVILSLTLFLAMLIEK